MYVHVLNSRRHTDRLPGWCFRLIRPGERSRHFLSLVALTVLLLGAGGCHSRASGDDPAASASADAVHPTVEMAVARCGAIEHVDRLSGQLVPLPDQEAAVSPLVSGVIDRVYVRFGEQVRRGQVIAHLSTATVDAQVRQAEATLAGAQVAVRQAIANATQQRAQTRTAIAQARAAVSAAQANVDGAQATLRANRAALATARQNLERTRSLVHGGVASQRDLELASLGVDTAQAGVTSQEATVSALRDTLRGTRQALEAAQAAVLQDEVKRQNVEVARQQLSSAVGALRGAVAQKAFYTLMAPCDGQVIAVRANVGETVDPSRVVALIANLSTLQLQVAVPVEHAAEVHAGLQLYFKVADAPGHIFHARLGVVGGAADAASSTVTATAEVANPDGLLHSGTVVSVHVVLARHERTVLVPDSALLTSKAGTQVLLIGHGDTVHVAPVHTGIIDGGWVEVLDGVKAGDRVVAKGGYGLPDGTRVVVANATSPAASTASPAPSSSGGAS